jgi:hypothetical protein
MNTDDLVKYWQLIHSTIREIWGITEPHIENAAIEKNIPIELYLYSELGLDEFSVEDFQKRDPFSNPDQFKKMFAQFAVKGWISTLHGGHYRISRQGREAVFEIVQAGDDRLAGFEGMSSDELKAVVKILKRITMANLEAAEPPQKWAIIRRFRVTHDLSPSLPRIRDLLLDLYAYRDDSHLSAARPYFNEAGIVWSVFSSVCDGRALTAEKIADAMSFRGYDVKDYAAALEAAVDAGWLEASVTSGIYQPTLRGRGMHTEVEKLTNEYFFRPWQVLSDDELIEFYDRLVKLHGQLQHFRKSL